VRVETAASDDVATGRRKSYLTAARQQRRGEKNRRANLCAKLGIEIPRVTSALRWQRVGAVHSTLTQPT
jgi:hypothetical protein